VPSVRSPAGYGLYRIEALAGLELIRTLQSVGHDLKTIRRVPGREVSLPEIASSDAELLPVQIRILGLRPAILRAVASQTTRAGGMDHHASVGEALGAGAGGKRRSLPEGGPQRSLRMLLSYWLRPFGWVLRRENAIFHGWTRSSRAGGVVRPQGIRT
jgi:hypothetical protein